MEAVQNLVQWAVGGVRRMPLGMWIYMVFLAYLYKRMMRDFLGVGTKRKSVLGKKSVDMTKEEEAVSHCVVDPKNIVVGFDDVGGLDEVKETLREMIVWPFQHPELFQPGSLRSPPKGVLLYGPPGTGKTMLAKALAKEVNGYFFEVRVEDLFSKWVGESEKMAGAIFSLARKLEPAVIFIDEIDSLLGSRCDSDSQVYTHTKTIFMTNWDGVSTDPTHRIVVVGATNRHHSLDDAIIRRMPIRREVPYPESGARETILRVLLANESLAPDVDLAALALVCDGYSGSDLKEMCKVAVMEPMKAVIRAKTASTPTILAPGHITDAHFRIAMKKVGASQHF
jgi:ATPase family AAA domain-containing protein 1